MHIPRKLAYALRLSIIDGAFYNIYWLVITGVILNGLALHLGAGAMHLAILNSLPVFSQIFSLIGARIIQARDIRKPFVLYTEAASRFIWLLTPLIVLLPEHGHARILGIIAIAALSHIFHSAGAVGWLSWISDLVPERIRGIYFGVRNAICGLVGLIGLTFASRWLDAVKLQNGAGQDYLKALLWLIAVSVLFAGLSLAALYFKPVKKMRRLTKSGWSSILLTFTDPSERSIAITWVMFSFSIGVAMSFYLPCMLERFNISYWGVTAHGWTTLVLATVSAPLMGRLADSIGNRKTFILAWLGIFWQPFLFIFTPNSAPHAFGLMPIPLLIDAMASGIFWTAYTIVQTNIVIAQVPSERRAGFAAALAAVAGLATFIGALVGGFIGDSIGKDGLVNILGITLDNYRAPMLLSVLLRLFAGITIFKIIEQTRKRPGVSGKKAFGEVWKIITQH